MDENPYQSPQATNPRLSLSEPSRLPCAHCGARCVALAVTTDGFGFREFECDSCRNITTLPLPHFHRTVYLLVLLGCVAAAIYTLAIGMFPVPGFLAIVPAYALYRDRRIRRANEQARAAYERARSKPPA